MRDSALFFSHFVKYWVWVWVCPSLFTPPFLLPRSDSPPPRFRVPVWLYRGREDCSPGQHRDKTPSLLGYGGVCVCVRVCVHFL